MILNKLIEATTDKFDPELAKVAKMTWEEYKTQINRDDKHHGSDAYQSDLKSLNRDYSLYFKGHGTYSNTPVAINDKAFFLFDKEHDTYLHAIIDRKTNELFYDEAFKEHEYDEWDFSHNFGGKSANEEGMQVRISKKTPVKFIGRVMKKYIGDAADQNLKEFPHNIGIKLFDGDYYNIRAEKELTDENKNKQASIAILNSSLQIVARADDEWGATLIQTAKEYRGKGFGTYLKKLWAMQNPNAVSGGLTSAGQYNAQKFWAKTVKDASARGLYGVWVNHDELTLDKAKEILTLSRKILSNTDVPAEVAKRETPKHSEQKSKPLIHADGLGVFIYDSILLDLPEEILNSDELDEFIDSKIYGFSYAGDYHGYDKTQIVMQRFDYDEGFHDLLWYATLQNVRDNAEYDGETVRFKKIDKLEKDLKYVKEVEPLHYHLTTNVMNIKDMVRLRELKLAKTDRYGELWIRIQEAADSKYGHLPTRADLR